jgi:hypothetical protein
MTPSVPLPTENLYKFVCMLGLALVISCVAAHVVLHGSQLSQKVQLLTEIADLEAVKPLPEQKLALKRQVLEVIVADEKTYRLALGVILGLGVVMIWAGGTKWYRDVQLRDDEVARLQLEKLTLEVEFLREARSRNRTKVQQDDG